MTTVKPAPGASRINLTSLFITAVGLYYSWVGLALLFAPRWFFANIGPFAPFNRHYMGDLGTFILPMGIGLLLAARQPAQHRLLLWIIGSANLLHSFNHVYDALLGQQPLSYWLSDTVPLLVGTALYFLALWPHRK